MSHLLEELKIAGNDIEEYLDRFEQDEETCEMLTSMFAQDTQFAEYLDSYEEKNYSECREHIHSIKGAAANVGLSLLSQKAQEIMRCIDSGEFDRLDSLTAELSDIYYSTIHILSEEFDR